MQQPDCRDQSDPDEKDETNESSQTVSNQTENQEASQTEQEEKEMDHPTVSSIMNNTTEPNSYWRPCAFALALLSAESQQHSLPSCNRSLLLPRYLLRKITFAALIPPLTKQRDSQCINKIDPFYIMGYADIWHTDRHSKLCLIWQRFIFPFL